VNIGISDDLQDRKDVYRRWGGKLIILIENTPELCDGAYALREIENLKERIRLCRRYPRVHLPIEGKCKSKAKLAMLVLAEKW
jgi:hypothetical protein